MLLYSTGVFSFTQLMPKMRDAGPGPRRKKWGWDGYSSRMFVFVKRVYLWVRRDGLLAPELNDHAPRDDDQKPYPRSAGNALFED
jgi:hypothetical protein